MTSENVKLLADVERGNVELLELHSIPFIAAHSDSEKAKKYSTELVNIQVKADLSLLWPHDYFDLRKL